MEKFLFFSKALGDMTCIPAHRLVEMEIDGSTTELDIRFRLQNNSTVGSNFQYPVLATINANSGEKVMRSISNAISSGKNPFVVVADKVNNEFIDVDITNISDLTGITNA
jgi:hypothetical protein|tara:strand:+ start:670 stop:999 length:330 start_codon:yes stop_codon:yes gene_type:complete